MALSKVRVLEEAINEHCTETAFSSSLNSVFKTVLNFNSKYLIHVSEPKINFEFA
jgi:hypothetical protein